MKKIIFLFFFSFFFLPFLASAEQVILTGPQWAVDRVCSEVHSVLPGASLTQIVREGNTSLQFRDQDGITRRVITISQVALTSEGRAVSDEALTLVAVWQGIPPAYEYRAGCSDVPWSRYSSGSQVWASAPMGQRVYEIVKKDNGMAKTKAVVCGRWQCSAYFCSPHRVPLSSALANLPAGAIRLVRPSDGSHQPVETEGLYVAP